MKKHCSILPVFMLLMLLCAACGTSAQVASTQATTPEQTVPSITQTAVTEATEATLPPIAPPKEEKLSVYSQLAEDISLPIISIYTRERQEVLSLTEYVECSVDVFNCGEEFLMDEVSAGIRVRGNSSAYYGDVDKIRKNRAPYRIKFQEKQNVLGLNDGAQCKSWVLLKTDWDLIRNEIAFRMARVILSENVYCSDSAFVRLYINEDLHGVYLLCEQSQVNPNRVDIHEPTAGYEGTDVGYFMEIDNYAWSEPDNIFFTQNYARGSATDIEGVTRNFVSAEYSIKSEIYSQAQTDFIGQYMNNLFTCLYHACKNDQYLTLSSGGSLMPADFTSSYEVADAVLDLDSVVNMYILEEIVHDHDCGEGSFFMGIDFSADSKMPKLQFTAPWDFNWAYDGDAAGQYYAAAFNDEEFVNGFGDRTNPWFVLLMGKDWFVELVRQRWTAIQKDGALYDCLQAMEDYLLTYAQDLTVEGVCSPDSAPYVLNWIRTRIQWLDSQWLITTP